MFNNLPPALKNLLIINTLIFVGAALLQSTGFDVNEMFGLHYFQAEKFHFFQLVSYMFLHANFQHLFFNMFGLFMFGRILEQVWGSQRFLLFYFVTGIGAGLVQEAVQLIELRPAIQEINGLIANMPSGGVNVGGDLITSRDGLLEFKTHMLNRFVTIGASGAVYGVLLAFGMLFPNTEMFIMFIPIPIKAKYMVIAYGLIELTSGIAGTGGGVAHFAHLGGMLFGFFLIRYWRKHTNNYY